MVYFRYVWHAFKKRYTLFFNSEEEKSIFHYGMGNRCHDGMYLLFLDYDDVPIEWIYDELKLLQHKFCLGTAYLFKTKNGVHALFLERLTLGTVLNAMDMTSIDKNYRKVPLLYARKVWVLRQSRKRDETIRYLGCLKPQQESERECSNAHLTYLKNQYNIPKEHIRSDLHLDDSQSILLGYYHIAKENN